MVQLNIINIDPVELRIDQNPASINWRFIPLYKFSLTENVKYWQIGRKNANTLEVRWGDVDSDDNLYATEIEVNPDDALKIARRKYKDKYKEGYRPGEIRNTEFSKGMKGVDYKESSIKSWPVYTQPKLNGIRMLCNDGNGETLVMRSWLNNQYKHLLHIQHELKEFFEYLPLGSMLDGELYNHKLTFSEITSAVKTIKSVHPNLDKISYWIFDINYEDPNYRPPYEDRYALLVSAYAKYIEDLEKIPTTFSIVQSDIAFNHQDIINQHDKHVRNGFEGIMIKKISNGSRKGINYTRSLYTPGKNTNIMKFKNFIDEEAIIIASYSDNILVRDKNGNEFNLNIVGDVGKQVTYRYLDKSKEGLPINPLPIAIRDYE